MHQRIPIPFAHNRMSVSCALSSLQFGLPGYAGYKKIDETLIANGFVPENRADPEALNHAIAQTLLSDDVESDGIHGMVINDVGLIDYARLSFLLFG